MGIIQNWIARKKERERLQESYEDDDRIRSKIGERKQSHNERVLKQLIEEDRQEAIKEALHWTDKVNKLKEKEKARNFMKFNQSWFDDRSNVIKQPFLFGGRGTW